MTYMYMYVIHMTEMYIVTIDLAHTFTFLLFDCASLLVLCLLGHLQPQYRPLGIGLCVDLVGEL